MSDADWTNEDRLLLEALDEVAAGGSVEERESARREVEAVLALLPYGLEPVDAPEGLRSRILDAVDGAAAGATATAARPWIRPAQAAPPAWPLRLAAGLGIVLLGVSAWLVTEVNRHQATIARLSEAQAREAVPVVDPATLEARDTLALITAPGTEICALKPTGEEETTPEASGVLYVAADHQHWYLTLRGLEPAPRDRTYQLWFHSEDGPVSAGTFRVESGRAVELGSETMPQGTRAVAVTLEGPGGSPAPSGPRVLWGDEVMTIL